MSNKAKYVDPPPKPTLEYKIAVTKNKRDSINILEFYESKHSTINCYRH